MKTRIVILAVTTALQACSSVSKETYTETRTLRYPKGQEPHLKDMYLRENPAAQEQNTYIASVAPAAPEPIPAVDPYQGDLALFANSDLPSSPQESDDEFYARMAKENSRLNAIAYNKMLRRLAE